MEWFHEGLNRIVQVRNFRKDRTGDTVLCEVQIGVKEFNDLPSMAKEKAKEWIVCPVKWETADKAVSYYTGVYGFPFKNPVNGEYITLYAQYPTMDSLIDYAGASEAWYLHYCIEPLLMDVPQSNDPPMTLEVFGFKSWNVEDYVGFVSQNVKL